MIGEMYTDWLSDFWRPCLEIFVISYIIYRILNFMRRTRAMQILKGLLFILGLFFMAQYFELHTINLLLSKFFPVAIIAVLIIFQSELRRALAGMGGGSFFTSFQTKEAVLNTLVQASSLLSKRRYGALIAIENELSLKTYIESGTRVDAIVTPQLLSTIFHPNTSLHDGGIVIQSNLIAAGGCLFPLSSRPLSYQSGTRHLAALGLSEETDAVIIVISEESGQISLVYQGKIMQNLDDKKLKKALYMRLIRRKKLRLSWNKRKKRK